MADLNELQATGMTKVIGSDSSGQEQTPVASTPNGEMKTAISGTLDDTGTTAAVEDSTSPVRITPQRALHTNLRNQAGTEIGTTSAPVNTQDAADGPVTPGTVATKSQLAGGQYNSTPPTLTNTQQAALQLTSNGSLKTTTDFSVVGGQLVPTITNKFRVRYSTTPATAGSAYSTIYTRSGTGLFFGFQGDFNNANVRLKITIDSNIIFEITIADLKTFQFNDTSATRMQAGAFWTTIGNVVDFSSRYAIPYATSITVEMQRSDASNHTMNQYMVFLTEDT